MDILNRVIYPAGSLRESPSESTPHAMLLKKKMRKIINLCADVL
jgi:hypothetical protein